MQEALFTFDWVKEIHTIVCMTKEIHEDAV